MNNSKDDPLARQPSLSYIEQTLKISPAPPQEPVTIYCAPKNANANLSKADIDIIARLEKLRHSSKVDLPSEDEVAVRLANLKGLPADHYTKKVEYNVPVTQTQVEQSDELFKQVMEEVSIDKKRAEIEANEIESRLARLRQSNDFSSNEKVQQPMDFQLQAESSNAASALHSEQIDDEVEMLMKDAKSEISAASQSLKGIYGDPEIAEALCLSKKSRKIQPKRTSSTSSGEKFSSDESYDAEREVSNESSAKEKEEVERIVQLYMNKAEKKKKRKLEKKNKIKEKREDEEDSSSSTESLTESCSDELSSLSDQ